MLFNGIFENIKLKFYQMKKTKLIAIFSMMNE